MRVDRRSFIRLVPLAVAVVLAGGSWWILRETTEAPTTQSVATVTTTEASQTTATASEAFDFPVTWNGDKATQVDLNEYRLKVDGDVSNPLSLALDDLRALSSVRRTLNIQCILGWAADVPWEGLLLSELLSLAGAPENLAEVTIESVTGHKMTLSSNDLANPDNMIALKAGGFSLTAEHGYPARLVAPTRSGLNWLKYVTRITCKKK
jgi:DMSO/TMAO reductase YedYZ molybdopterin-dependent catalytic subunit